MLKRDFIMRMVDQLSRVLIRVMKLKEEQNLPAARQELGDASRRLLGVNLEVLEALDEEQIVNLLNCDGDLLAAHAYVLGELFRESAELTRPEKAPHKTLPPWDKALHFYLLSWYKSREFEAADLPARLETLIDLAAPLHLPASTKLLLFRYLTAREQFAKAEDLLFDLAEEEYGNIAEIGEEFFAALLRKADAELRAIGLPRPELEEDLRHFRKLLPPGDS